jgi:hypothetical protein
MLNSRSRPRRSRKMKMTKRMRNPSRNLYRRRNRKSQPKGRLRSPQLKLPNLRKRKLRLPRNLWIRIKLRKMMRNSQSWVEALKQEMKRAREIRGKRRNPKRNRIPNHNS